MYTTTSLGVLPGFSWLWVMSPSIVAIIIILIDFGAVCLLMILEGKPPWKREMYNTFLFSDTIFIPLYFFTTAYLLHNNDLTGGFYTSTSWHIAILVLGLFSSLTIEFMAIKKGQYSWSQELSPSKIYHTFIFIILFYWIFSSLAPVIIMPKPWWAILALAIALIGELLMIYLDLKTTYLKNNHLEGTYFPWNWHNAEKKSENSHL